MADLMTAPVTFKKQSIQEFFIAPFFESEDIRSLMTVRTDIKGTETLNRISRPSKITKRKLVAGFTPSGSLALTNEEITVKPLTVEYEQNGRAFMDAVIQSALAKGYAEDDVANMSNPAFWDKIVLPIIAQAGQEDLMRQLFFAEETKEVLSGGFIAGVADADYRVYTGIWSKLMAASFASTIPAAQRVTLANGAVKQSVRYTLTGTTGGTLTFTINGVAYSKAWNTNIATTCTDWIATNAPLLLARGLLTGVLVATGGAGVIDFTASHAGQGFTIVATDPGTNGTLTPSVVVANVAAAALGTNEADETMENMIDAMPPEMNSFNPIFMISNSMYRNLIKTLKSDGSEQAHTAMINGVKTLMYEGYPVKVRYDWDKWIAADHNSVYPHRVILTPIENLLFACDGAGDDKSIESWYNMEAQMRRYRLQYKAQTTYLNKELIVLAF